METKVSETIRKIMNREDHFCSGNDIRLTETRPGYAVAEMQVTPRHLNGLGTVQGGALFTLADFAFAGAANAGNESTVTQNFDFHFLRSGRGPILRAAAQETARTRRTVLYEVKVYDGDTLIACGTATGFITGEPFLKPETPDGK